VAAISDLVVSTQAVPLLISLRELVECQHGLPHSLPLALLSLSTGLCRRFSPLASPGAHSVSKQGRLVRASSLAARFFINCSTILCEEWADLASASDDCTKDDAPTVVVGALRETLALAESALLAAWRAGAGVGEAPVGLSSVCDELLGLVRVFVTSEEVRLRAVCAVPLPRGAHRRPYTGFAAPCLLALGCLERPHLAHTSTALRTRSHCSRARAWMVFPRRALSRQRLLHGLASRSSAISLTDGLTRSRQQVRCEAVRMLGTLAVLFPALPIARAAVCAASPACLAYSPLAYRAALLLYCRESSR